MTNIRGRVERKEADFIRVPEYTKTDSPVAGLPRGCAHGPGACE
jgi:hypothetical protein